MEEDAVTEVVSSDPGVDLATDPPWMFTLALWIPAFAVVLWFMLRLFGGRFPDDPG